MEAEISVNCQVMYLTLAHNVMSVRRIDVICLLEFFSSRPILLFSLCKTTLKEIISQTD